MRFSSSPLSAVVLALVLGTETGIIVDGKKPHNRPISSVNRSHRRSSTVASASRPRVSPRRKPKYEEEEDEEIGFEESGYDDGPASLDEEVDDDIFEEEEEEEEEDDEYTPRKKQPRPTHRHPSVSRLSKQATLHASKVSHRRPPQKSRPPPRYDEEEEDAYPRNRRQPPSGRQRTVPNQSRPGRRTGPSNGRRPGSMVPYTQHRQPSVFARSLDAIRSSVPDPGTIREVASSSLNAARATTSSLSTNIYREIKGLTSSELEQVLLKATRPDDSPVKGKHVERLVGVTYQISSRFDIYDAVLRKLWAKMAEKDWRTKVKALYVLHRFSADGAPEHASALKAHLRELRRTRDPKRRDKYFNSKQLLAGEAKPENMKFRAFMSRYAHYVILRTQCFSGMFDEIAAEPKVDRKKAPKPITNTALRAEHLEAAAMLFKAGMACQLKDGEECENTAIAAERVASDLIGLTAAVAMALNRVLKEEDLKGGDPVLIQKWCELYKKQLVPQTKAMVKKVSTKLDAYGLFLPSRMGTSVSQELLSRGLSLLDEEEEEEPSTPADGTEDDELEYERSENQVNKDTSKDYDEQDAEDGDGLEDRSRKVKQARRLEEEDEEVEEEEEGDMDGDEYEYEEEEYYDDEED